MTCQRRPPRRYPRPAPQPLPQLPQLPTPPGRPRPRAPAAPGGRTLWLALAAALALLGPGLAIGALLHVNDILSADLLPGTLFLREQPANGTGDIPPPAASALTLAEGAAAAVRAKERARAGNWSDAFLTMNFHRRMMNEYLCRSYVAEQILGDMTGEPPEDGAPPDGASAAALSAPRRRLSNTLVVKEGREEADSGERSEEDADSSEPPANGTASPAPAPAGAPEPPEPTSDPRRRAADEARSNLPSFRRKPPTASSSTATPTRKRRRRRRRRRRRKRPGRRTAAADTKDSMLADEGSSAYKEWLARTTLLEDIYRHYDHIAQASAPTESLALPADTATFEGGEVTGFALTHAANSPAPALSPASFNLPVGLPVQQPALSSLGLHPGLNLATSINSFAAPPLPPLQPAPASSLGVGEDRNPFEYSGGGGEFVDSHEHHEHHEHPEYEHLEKGHHSKMLSLKDLFDLVLTAIAFLAFGAFAIHLIMCLMTIPNNNGGMMMMEVPGTGTDNGGTDNGAGEAEGGRRRRRRATVGPGSATPVVEAPGVSVEVLNRAAMRVLASIDAAMLAYQVPRRTAGGRALNEGAPDNRDCLHRALCRHNRYSRTVDAPFRTWMPIWSVGLSWVAGRLSPGTSTTAVATLDNLRASLLGLGNVRCAVVYPRCAGPDAGPDSGSAPPSTSAPTPTSSTPSSTTPTSTPPTVPPVPAPGIIHPAFSDLPKIVTMRPTPGAPGLPDGAGTSPTYTAIGVKTGGGGKKKRRRGPGQGPRAAARGAPRPRKRPHPSPGSG